jgi:hypothetical protein
MPDEPQINPESVALMQALLARPEVAAVAAAAFRRAHPNAPDAMINAAVFHVVSEGLQATVDWLASIEQFIRDPATGLDHGAVSHVLYHLYNWQQFQALLPLGRDGLLEQLDDIQHLIESEDDPKSAVRVVKELRAALDANLTPPSIE